MLKKMPIVLLGITLLALGLDGVLPEQVKSVLYATSLSIKALIVFVLPFLVFMLLFRAMARLANNATRMILLILVGVVCSNLLSIVMSQLVGSRIYNLDLAIALPPDTAGLAPAWTLALPKLLPNHYAMFSGLILGVLGSTNFPVVTAHISATFDWVITLIFRYILRLIPLFVLGFALKLTADKMLQSVAHHYSIIFVVVALTQLTYISFLYFAVSGFCLPVFLRYMKNMLPPALAGFSSMSSAASMPLTLLATEKNTGNPDFARLVIPTTVNIHLMGCCFAIPILTYAVMRNFGFAEPSMMQAMLFTLYFLMAKFSTAGIPGGGILIMLPILESHYGFHSQMSALISALYILLDPMITCSNILGNGALALVMNKVIGIERKKSLVPAE